MSQRLILRPEAQKDVAEAAEWYDQQSAGLSLRFRAALDKTFAAIEENPRLHAQVYRNLRRALVRRFLSVSSTFPGPTVSLWWQFYTLRETLAFGALVSKFAKARHAFDRTAQPCVSSGVV